MLYLPASVSNSLPVRHAETTRFDLKYNINNDILLYKLFSQKGCFSKRLRIFFLTTNTIYCILRFSIQDIDIVRTDLFSAKRGEIERETFSVSTPS